MDRNKNVYLEPHNHDVMSVTGWIDQSKLGITDAHNHVWIEAVRGLPADSLSLTDYNAILGELREYRNAGGGAILDCQPGGCGRNGPKLKNLSRMSGVAICACTGFHLRKYYPGDYWLWDASAEACADHFVKEMEKGMVESLGQTNPGKAGFIKVACEASLADTPQAPLEGAALAAARSGRMIAIHTEKGADAERIVPFIVDKGVGLNQIVVCHIDKRPDFGLHRSLAEMGIMLEYDTFYREKYSPDVNVYPLIERMVSAGHSKSLALATDMAEAAMWKSMGTGPGLVGFIQIVKRRLEEMGLDVEVIKRLMGGNISGRLAGSK